MSTTSVVLYCTVLGTPLPAMSNNAPWFTFKYNGDALPMAKLASWARTRTFSDSCTTITGLSMVACSTVLLHRESGSVVQLSVVEGAVPTPGVNVI